MVTSAAAPVRPPAGPEVLARAAGVRFVLTDCDGVLTDGGVYCSEAGEELLRFDRRDGMGVERLRELAGIETGIVTKERSGILARRAGKLGIRELHVGAEDKAAVLLEIAARRGLDRAKVAYIGDDVNDVPALVVAGFAACPRDASPEAAVVAHYVCSARGGRGAFRELAELVLQAVLRAEPVRA